MKNIVITGVSTGIGNGLAKVFLDHGYRVFGSVRKQQDAERLANEFGGGFIPLMIDLRTPDTIYKAAGEVKEYVREDGLAGLINNAGAAGIAPLALTPIPVFREHLETMVTGHLAAIQAFLPLLKAGPERKYPPGRIINISSNLGISGFPFVGPYVAAKHALEGLSKSLRTELLVCGIRVIVVRPGNVKTSIWQKQGEGDIEKFKETDYYGPMLRMWTLSREAIATNALETSTFCTRTLKIFESRRPRAVHTIVQNRLKYLLANKIVPENIRNRVISGKLGLKRQRKEIH